MFDCLQEGPVEVHRLGPISATGLDIVTGVLCLCLSLSPKFFLSSRPLDLLLSSSDCPTSGSQWAWSYFICVCVCGRGDLEYWVHAHVLCVLLGFGEDLYVCVCVCVMWTFDEIVLNFIMVMIFTFWLLATDSGWTRRALLEQKWLPLPWYSCVRAPFLLNVLFVVFLVYLFICYNAWRLSCHWYGFISLGTVVSFELSKFWCTKLCGCYSVRLSCSPTSTNLIYTTKLVNCNSKSTMRHQQKSDWNRTSSDLVMVIGSACFLIP